MLSASQYFHFSVSYSRNKEEVLKFSIQSQNVNKMKLSVNILTEGPVCFPCARRQNTYILLYFQ